MLPHFLIIGAMKGGTTSLYHYLASHPDIVPSSIKETDFFLTEDNFSKGLDWYKSQFRKNGKLAFEASPNYSKRHIFPGVPSRIASVLPDVKLIYVLRDPVERVVSHYVHNCAHGRESRPFLDVISDPNSNYIKTTKYYFQVQAFLDYYPERQVLLIKSEDLKKDPLEVLKTVSNFLDISPEYNNDIVEMRFHVSGRKKRKSPLEKMISERTRNPYVNAGVRLISKPFGETVERPVLSSIERDIINNEVASDIERLRRFSGLDFSDWAI